MSLLRLAVGCSPGTSGVPLPSRMPDLRLKLDGDAYALRWAGLVCSRVRGARLLSVAIVY